jgi:hypothetical protein
MMETVGSSPNTVSHNIALIVVLYYYFVARIAFALEGTIGGTLCTE